MYATTYEDVVFIEGRPQDAHILKELDVRIDGFFASAQLKSLDDVKKAMAKRVKELGGNSLVDFQYGQKQKGFWGTFISRDNVFWYGQGFAAVVPERTLNKLASNGGGPV